jgi:hypothetical protein
MTVAADYVLNTRTAVFMLVRKENLIHAMFGGTF